ncbi:uncharacterized protein F54H12.2-like [Gigantopelta aegis]|uniref:uncharacterized protein F54H12.2-like n=1 Tax=Gigantopelta aegis TaxID=1735272 RepID=UPI001B887B47|nr:uncharacterized protein F54H12.2-like [Gigantopelta aegis]
MSGKSGQEYKIDLQDIYFKICKLKMNSALILTHNKLFEKSNTLYPFTKTEVKISSIASSQHSYVWDSVFQSQCPNRLVVGFVDGDGVNGSYTKNPFNFQSSFVKTVGLYLDGVSVPARPIEGDDVSAYVNLFEGLNNWNQNSRNYIERTEFAFGNGLFVFSLEALEILKLLTVSLTKTFEEEEEEEEEEYMGVTEEEVEEEYMGVIEEEVEEGCLAGASVFGAFAYYHVWKNCSHTQGMMLIP